VAMITTIDDLKRLAKRRVPKMFYDYADSGSYTESTYRDNEAAFGRIKLRQRVARNIDNRVIKTQMIGRDVAMPVALAPVGLTGMQHADGEIAAAKAAEKFGVPFTLSTMSICSIEDVAAHTTVPFWFQLYVMRDRAFSESLIERAKAAKCEALVLTLDLQVLGQRHKDLKNGLSVPPKPNLAVILDLLTKPRWGLQMLGTERRTFRNIVGHAKGVTDLGSLSSWTNEQFDPTLDWSSIEWIKKRWDKKLILKGINDVEDAIIVLQLICCRVSWMSSVTGLKCMSMAAFAPVRIFSRQSPMVPNPLISAAHLFTASALWGKRASPKHLKFWPVNSIKQWRSAARPT
jgi:L-lactate dehydrogenase (cytochrome)